MTRQQPSRPLPFGYAASNPGRVRLNLIRYCYCHPASSLFLLVGPVFCAAMMLVHPHWVAGVIAFGIATLAYVSRLFIHFRSGDANPGVVISIDPLLVAAYTDLSKIGRPYPAVKVIRCTAFQLNLDEPKVGTKVPTVCMYAGKPSADRWTDFDPKPVSTATTNAEVIERVSMSFPKHQWQALVDAVRQLPKPYKRGMYTATGERLRNWGGGGKKKDRGR